MTDTTSPQVRPELDGFDPFSQDFSRDPDPMLGRAHRDSPVFWYEPLGCWFVTRYDDVEWVFTDSKTFSSRALRAVPVPAALRDRLPERPLNVNYINIDPPQHTRDRKASQRGFTRPIVAALEPKIREFATELIDAFADRGHCDFMQEFAYPLSLRVIVQVLGLPPSDMPRLRQWTEDMFSLMSAGAADEPDAPTRPMSEAEATERYTRLADAWDYFGEVVADRRAAPREDFLTVLSNSRTPEGEWTMDDDTIKTHLIELVAAGNDTTANLMGNLVQFLDHDPDQLEEVKRDGSLWEGVVEEGLRRRSTGPHLLRITTRDVELSGVKIPRGSIIVVNTTGANTDPAKFDDPLRFDVHRPNATDHLAFGKGRHFCLGAPLARLEAQVAMREVYGHLPGLTVPDQRLEYVPTMTVQTLKSLRIEWSR
ncbi:cytochrome P450 [Capillimicrobium parvum]|uniref:Cytochrome P450 YjiB n=1 Tax=Capillimicrobium parvum TaxID=2884022 RepID=A0A9E7C1A7_9ACTN|nr:cytochrome P450 [Capillimicrobium parvum]UGS37290.1 Putative cytochrome P450 YjiB [Capillimicrobium parvum]